MSNWLLIIIGVVIAIIVTIGVLLFWKRKNKKRLRRRKKVVVATAEMAERPPERDLYTDRYFEEHPVESATFDKPDLFDEPLDPSKTIAELTAEEPLEQLPPESAEAKKSETTEKSEPAEDEVKEEDTPSWKSEIIIALYVVAQREPGFLGTDIFTVLEDLGLKFGEMNIFHHYGFGELKHKKPVFSIANMVEPGTFNPKSMSEFASPGLALFMRLPGPFGGRVAFELMLNSAQRMAEVLEGLLEDERHSPLDQKKITALRERIANFEQRSTHNAHSNHRL